ncbi:7754_t:CDS:2, partial [Funneliformis mosseae]
SGKCQELSEIEYAIEMIAPIMSEIFNDTSEYINLRWGETLSNVMSDRRRKIDLRIIRIADKLELSHSECAKVPLPTKIIHDRSKCLRTLKGILNNFLKEDLSDEVRDSKILGIQFYGLHGQVIGVDLIDDGLYFGLEGSSFEFPTQLTNIKCLRNALEALFFFK